MEANRNKPATPRSPKRRKALLSAMLGIGLLSCGTIIFLNLPPDKSLDKVAIPVLSLRQLDRVLPLTSAVAAKQIQFVKWKTDDEVLVGKKFNASSWQICRMTVFPKPDVSPTPLSPAVILATETYPTTISPDGKWMGISNWVTKNGLIVKFLTGVVSLNGGKPIERNDATIHTGKWSPDSSKIYEDSVRNGGSIQVTDLLKHTTREIFVSKSRKIPIMDELFAVKSNPSGDVRLVIARKGGSFSGTSGTANWNSTSQRNSNISEMEIVEVKANDPETVLNKWMLKLPSDCVSGRVAASPNGDLLLWSLEQNRYTGLESLLHSLFPKIPFRNTPSEVWKISKLDGSDMHEIAQYSLPQNPIKSSYPDVTPVWTPGSKSVSFQKDDMLYVVPAD